MYNLIDFLCILSGCYLIYTGAVMKSQGKIVQNVVMGKGMTESSIKDKEGFINYLYWKLILVGAAIVIAGIISVYNAATGGSPLVTSATTGVFVVAIIIYGVCTTRALKKYVRR